MPTEPSLERMEAKQRRMSLWILWTGNLLEITSSLVTNNRIVRAFGNNRGGEVSAPKRLDVEG